MPIRKNVFETNSSSTHAIVIADDDRVNKFAHMELDDEGNIALYGRGFNWQWDRWNDPKMKASYCMVHAAMHDDRSKLMMLQDVIKNQTGANKVVLHAFTDSDYTESGLTADGNIDHQSSSVANKAFDSKESLRRFIFHIDSWLMLGNDNDSPPDPYFYHPNLEGLDGHLRIGGQQYPIEDIDNQAQIKHQLRDYFNERCKITQFVDLDIDWDNGTVTASAWEFGDKNSKKELWRDEDVKFQIIR